MCGKSVRTWLCVCWCLEVECRGVPRVVYCIGAGRGCILLSMGYSQSCWCIVSYMGLFCLMPNSFMFIWICLFDIKDMYTNIHQQDATHVIHNILTNYNKNIANNIQNILQIILQQNYFQFVNQYYKQSIGLAMGVPTSVIIAKHTYKI
jgi:hypothetical protein